MAHPQRQNEGQSRRCEQEDENCIVRSGGVEDQRAAVGTDASEDLMHHGDQASESSQMGHPEMITDEQHHERGRDEERGTEYQCKDHDGKDRLVDGDKGEHRDMRGE